MYVAVPRMERRMTPCITCGQPVPEVRKPREWFIRPSTGCIYETDQGAGYVHVREVLRIPKEERKPKVWTMWEGSPGTSVELTPAVRAALMNAGIEL